MYRRLGDASRQQLRRLLQRRIGVVGIRGLRLNAIRHCVRSYYHASDVHGTCGVRSGIRLSSSSILGLLVVDYPCIADMHGMYYICQLTVDFHCAYRASDMHGIYNHIVTEYTTTSSSDYYCVDYDYYSTSSSSRRGFALWASAVDAHLFFVPFPTERFMNGMPFSGLYGNGRYTLRRAYPRHR